MEIPVHRVRAALHALDAAETVAAAGDLPAALLPWLAEAFGADFAAWTDDGPIRTVVVVRRSDAHALTPTAFELSAVHVPLARGPSDRATPEEGDEQWISLRLDGAGGSSAHVVLFRSDPGFGDADLQLLEGLRSLLSRRLAVLTRLSVARQALSSREQEVLELVAAGLTDAAIAHRLGCRPRTVDKHLEHAYRTLGVGNRAAAVARWLREGSRPE